ncbi:hypothetical protein RB195_019464 [Necator americanus]|uniref:Uncharacterized protein n=1 Tax=Necator americanus TaxID=51031 RepID=A0ABR1CGJ2_NECAM
MPLMLLRIPVAVAATLYFLGIGCVYVVLSSSQTLSIESEIIAFDSSQQLRKFSSLIFQGWCKHQKSFETKYTGNDTKMRNMSLVHAWARSFLSNFTLTKTGSFRCGQSPVCTQFPIDSKSSCFQPMVIAVLLLSMMLLVMLILLLFALLHDFPIGIPP